ncbi:MAG TPA: transposase [Candidatus Acidoferrales bacterium]|nr:transposase [Candidatus Acidoferrales bacterium]
MPNFSAIACWVWVACSPSFRSDEFEASGSEIERAFSRTRSGVCIRPWPETHFSVGRIAALLLKPSRRMSAVQRRYRDSFLRFCPGAYRVRKLALQFRAMLRWRRTSRLAQSVATVTSSGFSFLAQFARTLRRDLGAVELAIETPWNNGPIKGQINRLKVI